MIKTMQITGMVKGLNENYDSEYQEPFVLNLPLEAPISSVEQFFCPPHCPNYRVTLEKLNHRTKEK